MEHVHPWTHSCTTASAGLLFQAVPESFRIYSAVYLVSRVDKCDGLYREKVAKVKVQAHSAHSTYYTLIFTTTTTSLLPVLVADARQNTHKGRVEEDSDGHCPVHPLPDHQCLHIHGLCLSGTETPGQVLLPLGHIHSDLPGQLLCDPARTTLTPQPAHLLRGQCGH